jgi:predicted O-methyltransferase YrrM
MKIKLTEKSVKLVEEIAKAIPTFHHHYHILFDIADEKFNQINYLEIGAYAGASACLMMNRPNTNVISIDIANPMPKENVINYIYNNTNTTNKYKYIKGSSQEFTTKAEVMEYLLQQDNKSVKLLFIDGDHSFQAVIDDFNMYKDLVEVGGYIVFDDYCDWEHSPQVRTAVDTIVQNETDYEIIGCFENTLGAYPKDLTEGNCFVIKKLK